MYFQKSHLVEEDIFAYLIADGDNLHVLDGNRMARGYFQDENGFSSLETIFAEQDDFPSILSTLTKETSIHYKNIMIHHGHGSKMVCDVEICLTDVEKNTLFLTIKTKEVEEHRNLRDLVELDQNPVIVMNPDKQFTIVFGNEQFYRCICMDENQFASKSESSFLGFIAEDKRQSFQIMVGQRLNQENECDIDVEITFDGQYYHLFRLNAFESLVNGKLYGVLIGVKRQSELMKKIEYDQQYFDIMQLFSKDLLFRIDIRKRNLVHRGDISKFLDLQPEVEQFPESIRDKRWVHPDDLEGYIAFSYRLIHGMDSSFEPRFQFRDGSYERYRLQGKVLFDEEGKPIQIVGKAENIQKYVEIEAKANYDSLTTALNKSSFMELVSNVLERAVEQDRFALLFLDFDNFKGVNDTMGHTFGDFLLEATSKRILHCVRNQDKVGRVGGDEFVIFLQHAPTPEGVLERAEAILTSLRRDFNNGDLRYNIRASIGISLFPEHGTTYEILYQKADEALYQSKGLGKDVATIYTPSSKE